MNAKQYETELKRLGIESEECCRIFGYSLRTSFRWSNEGPPDTVAVIMKVAKSKAHLIELMKTA